MQRTQRSLLHALQSSRKQFSKFPISFFLKFNHSTINFYFVSFSEFGAKIFKAKVLAKKLVVLLEDRDKNVRDESKKMVLELWHWIGPPFRNDLSTLKPVVVSYF